MTLRISDLYFSEQGHLLLFMGAVLFVAAAILAVDLWRRNREL